MALIETFVTSVADGHRHFWSKGSVFSTFDARHRHRLKGFHAIPNEIGGHSHLLLNVPERSFNIQLGGR